MNKLIVSMMILFLACTMLSSFMEGAGGFVATRLTSAISAAATTIPAANTTGFLSEDYIVVGNEEIAYTGLTATSFTGCVRGYNDTEAVSHSTNSTIYSSELSPLNVALGFNIATTAATSGVAAIAMIPYRFFTKSVPKMIMFDYSFFYGQLVYLRIFFQALGVGFAVVMALWAINALMGIFRP